MRKTLHGFALPLIALAAVAAPANAQDSGAVEPPPQNRAMTAQDLVTLPRLGGATVDPASQRALYPVTTTDGASYERTTAYYLKDLQRPQDGATALTLPKDAHSPAFGEGNTVYFLAPGLGDGAKESYEQLWRGTLAKGGSVIGVRQLSKTLNDITGFVLSPNADRVVLTAELPRECADLSCNPAIFAQDAPDKAGSARLYDADEGFVRHWDGWKTPGIYARAFAYTIAKDRLTGPVALDGPAGDSTLVGNTPTQPFGGMEDIAWSADGSAVYFVMRETGKVEPTSTNTDIYLNALSGEAPINITYTNKAMDTLPVPSPDGRMLAYLAMARPGYESDRQVIHLRDLASGKVRALTQDFDRSFGSLAWTPDSRWIVATAQDVLDTPAFRIDPQTGAVEPLDLMAGNEAHIGDIAVLDGGGLLFTHDSIGAPGELYLSRGWGQAEPLTDVATSQVGKMAATVSTRFSFLGAGGDTVYGQITKLAGREGKMPAILYVHGGPQGSFNDGWSTRWNPRVVASQGYAVVSVDFHGSTGYGQKFTDSINRDWGGKPLEDLQKGLAAALKLDSQIDGSRACAMGASYGGYMMNWIAGKWSDRFDCLVQHDGLFDMRSFYYSTEELWFPRWDFGGSYAENSKLYERWNPVNHVKDWKTPMLVITGEKDFRVPYTQGLQSFTALQEQSVPAELLVFPDENHWVLGAKNSLQWHNTVFDWLGRWLKPDSE